MMASAGKHSEGGVDIDEKIGWFALLVSEFEGYFQW